MTNKSEATVEPDEEQIETEFAPDARSQMQDVLLVTAPVFGVVLSSALGVLLFLH